MAAFALGGLLVSAGLSVLTYFWARTYLVDQRQSSAVHQAQANAQFVRSQLRPSSADVSGLLSSMQTPSTAQSLVFHAGRWFGTSATAGPDALPAALRSLVLAGGRSARQRYQKGAHQELAVGIPLAAGDAYFEIFSLGDLASTLRTLRDSLAAGSLAGFLLSLAIGAWATRRVLRPVRDIGVAASAIASGRLDARLDAEGDQELADLATGFNTMVDSLQARIERDARFASDVSHELRSPLTTLHSAVEVMQRRRGQLDAKAARALDLLGAEVARFEQLVEDLLEISRYDAGVARLDLETVDLVVLSKGLLADAGQPTRVTTNTDSATILADRRRLEQSLRNIIANAVAHAGGVVSMAVTVGERWTEITVEDRGPGVDDEDRQAIFERFARGKAAGRRSSGSGVGLGLALVAEHVRIQGGTVRAESAVPRGSRFVVQLPTRHP
jgi:two-component system sensor histidine kinase MtrB